MKAIRWERSAALALLGGVLALLLLAPVALAAQNDAGPRSKFRRGNDVVIEAGETVAHDLYIYADTVRVDGRIEGDLFVLARALTVTGTVTGGLFATSAEVSVDGSVEGSVRVLASSVTLRGQVRKDLLAIAAELTLASPSRIGGDLMYAAADATLNGSVDGGVLGSTREPAPRPATLIARDFSQGVPPEAVPQREDVSEGGSSGGNGVRRAIFRFLSIILAGGLLLWLAARTSWRAAVLGERRPLRTLGAGALTLLFLVVALLGFALAVLDLLLAGDDVIGRLLVIVMAAGALVGGSIVLFVLSVTVLFVANAITSLAIGRIILRRTPGTWGTRAFLAMLLGALVVTVLTALPFVGSLLNVITVVFGLGALVLAIRQRERTEPV